VKKTLIATAVSTVLASFLCAPVMAQSMSLDQVSRELQELKEKNDRLEAEVQYLKENAKAQHVDAANEAADIDKLKASTSKFSWVGDFRYRHEEIQTEGNVTDRSGDRLRLRFGAQVKVNDTINAKVLFSSTNVGASNARSTNQTLGNGTANNGAWDRKILSIDQAYVDWKPFATTDVILGKMPMPWIRTASYFWDTDLTPEGGALKFGHGMWFANASFMRMAEQDSATSVARSTDTNLVVMQAGIKPTFGATTLTLAASYIDIHHIQDQPVSVTGTGCPDFAAANPTFAGSSFGNTVYTDGTGANTCSLLLGGFEGIQLLAQLDFSIGALPVMVFADLMKNNDAPVNPVTNSKLDMGQSFGFMLNKASAVHSWEAGVLYQVDQKDAVFGQFVDSDFGSGITDTKGYALKAGFVPAANWILNATYFMNTRFNDVGQANGTLPAGTKDHDYKRLQLDLNYKF
jgi:outer membrane murein-binding lipoprotein Lpp